MSKKFAHLHVHGSHSQLDGHSKVNELVDAARADGQPGISQTDHGNLHGLVEMYRECAKHDDIKFVPGIEAYFADDRLVKENVRQDKAHGDIDGSDKRYYHLTLLAENNTGYHNLLKISSDAFLNGYWYKPRCLVAGQEIVTKSGVKNIEDIEIGDLVLTHKGRWMPVVKTMVNNYDGEIYGINLNNRYGRTTWMTPEHPVLTRDRQGQKSWKQAKDLLFGRPSKTENIHNWNEFVCLPKPKIDEKFFEIKVSDYTDWKFFNGKFIKKVERVTIGPTNHYAECQNVISLDYDFGFFLGLYAAEGHAEKNEFVFTLHEDEVDYADAIVEFYHKLTGRTATVSGRSDRPDYKGVSVRCSHTVLAQMMTELCGSGANNKQLPEWTFDAPAEFRRGVIEGVLGGDGAIRENVIVFCQTSEMLAWQMRTLEAQHSSSFANIKEQWDNDLNHHVQYRSNYSRAQTRKFMSDNDYVYRPIANIEKKFYSGKVYNIEVAEDHSYVSDFTMHNCDWSTIEKWSEGLIASTGCLGGPVLQKILHGDNEGALATAARLQDIFGRDNLFVELMNHGLREQLKTNPVLIDIAKKLDAPLLATNDSHYTLQSHSISHDALLCCQTGAKIADEKRFRFETDEHYLKSSAEMRQLFNEQPSSCDNTLWIVERSNVKLDFDTLHLPAFPLPVEYLSDSDYLIDLVKDGLEWRYGTLSDEVLDRAAYELSVIKSLNLSSYFLIFWDLVQFTKQENILTGPGRGSSAGSIVAYALGITKVDPLLHDLMFERFINPERIALADIDWDISTRDREKVVNYTRQTYGEEYVAQIITFSKIKARTAVRDAARVLGYPNMKGDEIAKAMPPLITGIATPLYACFEKTKGYEAGYQNAGPIRDMYDRDQDAHKIIDVALGLEGLDRQDGVHAAGTVIGDRPLVELVPLQRKKNKDGSLGPIVTQYEKNTIEDLGLLKMDFLGLLNLDIIQDCLAYLGKTPDVLDSLDISDPETYAMLARGEGVGVFQVESGPMRALMKRMAPNCMDDLAAILALYRPGPMASNMHNDYADRKNGRQAVSYFHEDARDILSKTQGLMYFQESVMQIAQKFAGYSLSTADNLRKIMGKKLPEKMALEKDKFITGCVEQGYGQKLGEELFHTIEAFAAYGFPKGHAFGYGYITYWTAYLKCHHPAEYMAAICSSVMDDLDKTARYLGEARRMGLKVYPPDVNKSELHYTVEEDGIRIGLGTLKNMGEDSAVNLIEIREQEPFKDLYDLAIRVNPKAPALRSLAYSGALDGWGTRQGIASVVDEVLKVTRKDAKKIDQGSLFETAEIVNFHIPETEYSWHELLSKEKEVLGIYASGHPLEDYTEHATGRSIMDASEAEEKASVKMLAIVTDVVVKYTKAQKAMANVLIEDQTGALELVAFPKSFEDYGSVLQPGAVVRVTIRKGYDDFREQPNYVLTYAEPVESKIATATLDQFGIFVPKGFHTKPVYMSKLKGVLLQNHGTIPADIYISRSTKIKLENQYLVNGSQKLKDELKALFVEFRGEG